MYTLSTSWFVFFYYVLCETKPTPSSSRTISIYIHILMILLVGGMPIVMFLSCKKTVLFPVVWKTETDTFWTQYCVAVSQRSYLDLQLPHICMMHFSGTCKIWERLLHIVKVYFEMKSMSTQSFTNRNLLRCNIQFEHEWIINKLQWVVKFKIFKELDKLIFIMAFYYDCLHNL